MKFLPIIYLDHLLVSGCLISQLVSRALCDVKYQLILKEPWLEMGTSHWFSGLWCFLADSWTRCTAVQRPAPTSSHPHGSRPQLPCSTSSRHCLWVGTHWRGQGSKLLNTCLATCQTSMNTQPGISCPSLVMTKQKRSVAIHREQIKKWSPVWGWTLFIPLCFS